MEKKHDERPEVVNGERMYYMPDEDAGATLPETPSEPMVTVRRFLGAGVMCHRYGVSFVHAGTALVPVGVAKQMVREFPMEFGIEVEQPAATVRFKRRPLTGEKE